MSLGEATPSAAEAGAGTPRPAPGPAPAGPHAGGASPARAHPGGLGGIARAVGWAAVEEWGRRLLGLATFVLLARLLEPKAFGVVALGLLYVEVAQMFVLQGLPTALIQRKELGPAHLDTAFWCALASAAALCGLGVLARRPLARALGDASAADLLGAVALGLILLALGIVPTALLMRELQFQRLALRATLGTLAGGVAGLAGALTGAGAWALVLQHLVGAGCATVCLWTSVTWRPGFRVTRQALRDLWGFSLAVLGNHVLWVLSQRADHAAAARLLGAHALGLYSTALRLPTLAREALAGPPSRVALTAFSRLQADPERLALAFVRSTSHLAAAATPPFVGLAWLAPRAVPALLGARWAAAVPALQAFCALNLVAATLSFIHPAFMALGRPGVYSALIAVHALAGLAAALAAGPHGVTPLAWAVTAAYAASASLSLSVLRRYLRFRWGTLGRALAPVGVAGLAAAAALALLDAWLPSHVPAALDLALRAAAAAAAYLAALAWIWPSPLGLSAMVRAAACPGGRAGLPGAPAARR